MQLFVGGVPHAATEQDILEFCETVGEVYRLHVPIKDRKDGFNNPGYAFATYMSKVSAARAIEELSGKTMPNYHNLVCVNPDAHASAMIRALKDSTSWIL